MITQNGFDCPLYNNNVELKDCPKYDEKQMHT